METFLRLRKENFRVSVNWTDFWAFNEEFLKSTVKTTQKQLGEIAKNMCINWPKKKKTIKKMTFSFFWGEERKKQLKSSFFQRGSEKKFFFFSHSHKKVLRRMKWNEDKKVNVEWLLRIRGNGDKRNGELLRFVPLFSVFRLLWTNAPGRDRIGLVNEPLPVKINSLFWI